MRCAHGSINEILMEWDPGPTYVVQRLWDPGEPTYSSRSSVPTDLDELGKLKSYLDYIYLPGLSSLPFLVAVMLNLAPNNHLGKLDHMGSFRYLPRLDQQVYHTDRKLSSGVMYRNFSWHCLTSGHKNLKKKIPSKIPSFIGVINLVPATQNGQ